MNDTIILSENKRQFIISINVTENETLTCRAFNEINLNLKKHYILVTGMVNATLDSKQ